MQDLLQLQLPRHLFRHRPQKAAVRLPGYSSSQGTTFDAMLLAGFNRLPNIGASLNSSYIQSSAILSWLLSRASSFHSSLATLTLRPQQAKFKSGSTRYPPASGNRHASIANANAAKATQRWSISKPLKVLAQHTIDSAASRQSFHLHTHRNQHQESGH